MKMDKICGHIDCGRYDTDDVLCDYCECNWRPDENHSAPSSTISDDHCRDVGRSRHTGNTIGLATTNPDHHPYAPPSEG